MRCIICDYTHSGASLMSEGVFQHSTSRRFRWDEQAAGMLCSECEAEAADALSEFEDESEDDLDEEITEY